MTSSGDPVDPVDPVQPGEAVEVGEAGSGEAGSGVEARPKRRFRSLLMLLAFVALAVGIWFAFSAFEEEPHPDRPITWSVRADTSGLDPLQRATTADGTLVRLDGGSLTIDTAELLECEHSHDLMTRLFGFISTPRAEAGHGDGFEAVAQGPKVIDLTSDAERRLGSARISELAQCGADIGFSPTNAADRLGGATESTLRLGLTSDSGETFVETDEDFGLTLDETFLTAPVSTTTDPEIGQAVLIVDVARLIAQVDLSQSDPAESAEDALKAIEPALRIELRVS